MKKITLTLFLALHLPAITQQNTRIQNAYFELAEALNEQGNALEAVNHYKKVLEINPENNPCLFRLGCVLHQLGDHDNALVYFKKRLQNNGPCAQTEFGIGQCWKAKKNIERAIKHFRKAYELNPQSLNTCYELAQCLEESAQCEQSAQVYKKGLETHHNSRTLLEKYMHILIKLHHYNKALECCDKLFSLGIKEGKLFAQRAHLLTMCGRLKEARTAYKRFLEHAPNDSKILYNIAYTYTKSGNIEKALNYYQQALVANPKNRRAYLGIAQTLLSKGNTKQGWEALALYNTLSGHRTTFSLTENLTNKTVLIGGEWLHEDMIQFIRYAEEIKKRGATVVVQTPQPLVNLFTSCPYIDDVIVMGNQNRGDNNHLFVPLLSMPHLFETHEKNIPNSMPYLQAHSELKKLWHTKLSINDNTLNIGLHLYTRNNIPLKPFFELAQNDNIHFYIMQTDVPFHVPHNFSNNTVTRIVGTHFTEQQDDLDNLAAIIKNLDIIITGDSTIAHLAGAMNVPVFVILSDVVSWRWQINRTDCPWYPSMTLFRKEKEKSWSCIIEAIKKELEKTTKNLKLNSVQI